MADGPISTLATVFLSGGAGVMGAQVIQWLRDRRPQKLNEVKAPSEIEATISAGARDAVTALRDALVETRTELAETREQHRVEIAEVRARLDECEAARVQITGEMALLRRKVDRK